MVAGEAWMVGRVLETVTDIDVEAEFPAKSVAIAVMVWEPSDVVLVFHEYVYGD